MDYKQLRDLALHHETPVLFLSKNRLKANCDALHSVLPGVDIYYAVKSNSIPEILTVLAEENMFFDVCTSGEIEDVQAAGITGARCLHTHPVKTDREIKNALDFGISLFVADNEYELKKLVPYKDTLKVLIRLSIQNPGCVVNLSHKFGVEPEAAFDLIKAAHERGLMVEGICFHVGSQNENSLKFNEALEYCRDICRKAALAGIVLKIIDIGGGFPIDYVTSAVPLTKFCLPVNEYLERYFAGYRIIAEPGRYISGTSMTLATSIIGKSLRNGVWWYYLDDGVYGSFSGKIYDHADYPMIVPREGERFSSTLAGPTCDSIDVIYENIPLPELEIGDILLFESMGAYTNASASNFNGFPKAKVVVID
ncbi:MAG: type III PLP-dependent enzyme [Chitinivibrionales bacterium]|nr:type III PLP-dependent enzyme [Chitinivibrionales bacterium]